MPLASGARRTGRAATAVVAASLLLLPVAGCSGRIPELSRQDNPTQGTNTVGTAAQAGPLAIRGMFVETLEDGAGVQVIGTIRNNGDAPDALVSATVNGQPATVPTDAVIEPGTSLRLGPPGDLVEVRGAQATPGFFTEIVLAFRSAPQTTVPVLVRSSAEPTTTVETPTASPLPEGEPAGEVTARPTEQAVTPPPGPGQATEVPAPE